jgi:hypothetical protein
VGYLLRIVGATATVSTFVTVVGHPHAPTFAGKGGLRRGLPGFPSRLSISAVSSPQMYAPAPARIKYKAQKKQEREKKEKLAAMYLHPINCL